jgi:hypothetical protein
VPRVSTIASVSRSPSSAAAARETRLAGLLYLAFGAIVLLFLLGTVHRRTDAEIQTFNDRFHRVVQVWIEHGYLKHGGLAFTEPGELNPRQTIWRSSSMAFLQGAHVLERLHYLLRGSYSYRLMLLHNQVMVLLTAAAIALLSMRLALRIGLRREHALILGLASLAVFQTFPHNLFYYWEILPTLAVVLVASSWLLLEESFVGQDSEPHWVGRCRAVLVFLLVWIEPVSAAFMIGAFVGACFLLAPESFRRVALVRNVLLPAAAGVLMLMLQVLWVRYRFPEVTLEGSSFLFRTGLDGSTQYVEGHWDLVTRRWPTPDWAINFWKWLFCAGVAATTAVYTFYLRGQSTLRSSVFVLSVAFGLYIPLAFAFLQSVAIHPYGYDIYLLLPFVIALFGVAPAILEQRSHNTGVFVYATVVLAWCFAFVQLRTYAIQFPLK